MCVFLLIKLYTDLLSRDIVGAGGHPGSPQHQAQQQQQQQRAGTPDSQISVGSSASQKRTPAGYPAGGQSQAYPGQGQPPQQGQPQGQPQGQQYGGYQQGAFAQQPGIFGLLNVADRYFLVF